MKANIVTEVKTNIFDKGMLKPGTAIRVYEDAFIANALIEAVGDDYFIYGYVDEDIISHEEVGIEKVLNGRVEVEILGEVPVRGIL